MRSDELEQIISKGDLKLSSFKTSAILSDPFKIARIMVAFANNAHVLTPYGGLILVGVNDDGTLEGIEQKQGHEEYIMNVARDKMPTCIQPKFEMVTISKKKFMLIAKNENVPSRGKVFGLQCILH